MEKGFNFEWRSWMEEAQRGDKEAYRKLLLEIQPVVMSYLFNRVQNKAIVDDLCQTILMKVHSARHTYNSKYPFEPWLYAISRHTLYDYFKKEAKRGQHVNIDESSESWMHDEPVHGEQKIAVGQAFEELPESQRNALESIALEGKDLKQAAKEANVSVGSMKVRFHRAYKSFRSKVGK
jgi:RNA polymerase sigma-70 factor (ECF subfamily)